MTAQWYDVIVVGAGPAGAAAGIALARQGAKVLLLDKAAFPRDKPCGGGLTAKSLRLLDGLLGEGAIEPVVRARSARCRFVYRGRLVTEAEGSEPLSFVSRREFDALLVGAARSAGCDLREDARVVHVDGGRTAVTLASGEELAADFLVGADGATSVFHRRSRPVRRRGLGVGLVAEMPVAYAQHDADGQLLSGTPSIHFGLVPWGYGWIFPRGDVVNVGVGGIGGRAPRYRQALRELVAAHFRPSQAPTIRGHVLPFGRFAPAPGHGSVLLIGDAAGLVEPVTGEGIALALESGGLAAQVIGEAVSLGAPAKAGGIYAALLRQRVLGPLRQAARARWLLFPRWCLPLAMRSLRRHPELASAYLDVVAGKLSYRQYAGRVMRAVL